MKILASNKKAFFNYTIRDQLTAGVVLSGSETKSAKSGSASLAGSYVTLRNGQAYLVKAHITAYKYSGGISSYDPEKDRKLLLNKKEIDALVGKEKGSVIIPLELIQVRNLIKLKIGLGFGKKKYDKRESIKKKDIERKIRRGGEY